MSSSEKTKTSVLIVEDSPTQAEKLRYILEAEGYLASVAGNGRQALLALDQDKPDIIISDIIMPEMDGFQLCEQLKADENFRDIPFVLLTALSAPEDIAKGLQCQADHFITKPYERSFLVARLQSILDNRELRRVQKTETGVDISIGGKRYIVKSGRRQILDFLLSTYETALQQNAELARARDELKTLSEGLEEKVRERTAALHEEITQRGQAEERVTRLNSVLKAIRSVDQLIVHEKDREHVIQKACDLLVQTPSYGLAWILLVDESKEFISFAAAGLATELYSAIRGQMKRGEYPQCTRDIFESESAFTALDDVSTCHGGCPLSAHHAGGAGFVNRLEYEGRVYGAMLVGVPRDVTTDEEEMGLFLELAGDISFALANIEKGEERKRAEERLRQSEEKLRVIIESIPQGVTVSDLDGNILQVNDAILQIHGYDDKQELIGRSAFALVAEEDHKRAARSLQETILNGYSGTLEYTFVRQDGSTFPAQLSAASIKDASGRVIGFVAVTEDITERKKMAEQLMVTDRMASVGELASGIAHELNNPLTSVIGLSELLLEKKVPGEVGEDLRTICGEAQRAARVVKNLLTFARKHPLTREPVSVNEVIEKVLALRAYEQKINNIQVNAALAPSLSNVLGDYFQLQQVFLNIIINAEFFMIQAHGRGTLTISTEQEGNITRISITDDGPGISQEDLTHLFVPFFTTKEVGKGTGLGLSICHGIVTEHNGRIYATSEPGQGATFVVELPVAVKEG